MKKTSVLMFFILGIMFSYQGICANSDKSAQPSVDECLKELETVGDDDWDRWVPIKKRCYLMAEANFQEDKSYENQWWLVRAGVSLAYEDERGMKAFYNEFVAKYFSSFSMDGLERADLEFLFKSYEKLAFFLSKENIVNRFEELYYKIKSFRATTLEEDESLLVALIYNGSWEKVEKFQMDISKFLIDPMNLENLKLLKNQNHPEGPKLYELKINWELEIKNYTPQKEFSVVIVSSPNCGFSTWAMSEIEEDKELLDFFKEYGTFILSHTGFLEVNELGKWNVEHKSIPLKIVYNEEEWPSQIDWDGTPTFIVFKGNEYSHTVHGWDKEKVKKSIEWLKEGTGEFKF